MPTEIISNLWIGTLKEVRSKDFYKDKNIQLIINCTIDSPFLKVMIHPISAMIIYLN